MSRFTEKFSDHLHPVGVVMRSNAPLVDHLLAEQEQSDYAIAIDETRSRWKLAIALGGTASLLAFFSLLDIFKLTK